MATGIEQHGNNIRIRLWHKKQEYRIVVEGNIHSKSDLTAAIKLRQQLKARLKLGLAISADEASENPLFSEAAQEYINNLAAEYSTHISYENIINNVWLPTLNNKMLGDITTRDIRNILNAQDRHQNTKKNYLAPLRGIFNYYDITPNPAAIKVGGKEQRAPIKRFTPNEREIILNQLSGQFLVYFAIAFGCGLRPSEIIALQWSDYKDQQLSVSKTIVRRRFKGSTKTHKSRVVYVPEWTRVILEAHPTRFDGGYIFVKNFGRPYMDTELFNTAWRDAFDSHTIKRKHRMPYRIPYTCRHSRAAEMLSIGIAPGDAAKQLGHSLQMFYRVYAEWIEDYADATDFSRFETKNRPKTAQKDEKKG